MPSLPSLLFPLSFFYTLSLAASQGSLHDNSQSCNCYTLDSEADKSYFLYHRFYDFRNLATKAGQYTNAPPLIQANQRWGKEPVSDSDVLNTSKWKEDWGIQDWGKKSDAEAPVAMQNSPANVFISQLNTSSGGSIPQTYLTLRTTRLPTFQSTAEIENEQKNLLHASLRFRARVVGAPGAVAGLFTFFDDTNESDIEILTTDPPTTYRFTNQPATKKGDDVQGASVAPTNLPPWNEWRTYRIDWLAGMSRWYVDDKFIAQNSYSVPRKPSGLVLNMWSDGGVWSGNMSVGQSAELQFQWVQIVFNTSGKREGPGASRGGHKKRGLGLADLSQPVDMSMEKRGMSEFGEIAELGRNLSEKRGEKGCKTVCKVDGVEKEGFPQVAWVSTGGAVGLSSPSSFRTVIAVVTIAIGIAFV